MKPLGKWIRTGCILEKLKKLSKEHVMWSVAPESIIQGVQLEKQCAVCALDKELGLVVVQKEKWVPKNISGESLELDLDT